MLEDWSGMDKEKAKEYIINCQVCIASALFFGCLLSCIHSGFLQVMVIGAHKLKFK